MMFGEVPRKNVKLLIKIEQYGTKSANDIKKMLIFDKIVWAKL